MIMSAATNTSTSIADEADYDGGCHGGKWSEKQTIRVTIKNFAGLRQVFSERNFRWSSPPMRAHGCDWEIWVYPGGYTSADKKYISVYLARGAGERASEDGGQRANYRLRLPSAGCNTFYSERTFKGEGGGAGKFFPRDDVIKNFLVDGALVIEADIRIPKSNYAKSTLQNDMIRFLTEANETGDVKFIVEGKEFAAHSHILLLRAPMTAELVDGVPADTSVPIEGSKKKEFDAILRYVYANETPDWAESCLEPRDILAASGKFGCLGLKLLAEAELAENHITDETAADLLLLADSKNCALLKEKATIFLAENAAKVMMTSGWTRLGELAQLLKEITEISLGNKKPVGKTTAETDYERMCVSELRGELESRGLDVDGSKGMLVSHLERSDASINFIFGSADDGDY